MEWIDNPSPMQEHSSIESDDALVQYAMRNYDNPQCTGIEEFKEDLDKIRYLKRLFTMYKKDGDLRERLILNHLITFYNVFGIIPSTRMLFSRIPPEHHPALRSFMEFLNVYPMADHKEIPETDLRKVPVDISVRRKLERI